MSDMTVDYYFTITSPWSYMGHLPFLELAAETGHTVAFKPVDFGPVFAQSGGLPLPKRPPQRRRYRMFELQRWKDYREADLILQPKHFPADANLGNRMVLMASDRGLDAGALAQGFMRGCWFEEQDVGDQASLVAIADKLGMDGASLADEANSADGKARADQLTQEAMDAQVFGAPTYVIRGEPFWGQDRLELVARALRREAGPYTVEGTV
ncbi:MAG: DsbA family protein [Alphaproteobacteria bacterium]